MHSSSYLPLIYRFYSTQAHDATMHVPHLHQAVILGLVFYAVTSVALPVPWPVDVVSKAVGIAKVRYVLKLFYL